MKKKCKRREYEEDLERSNIMVSTKNPKLKIQ